MKNTISVLAETVRGGSSGRTIVRLANRLLCTMLVLFCVGFCAQNAQAQCTSTASGNWNVGANWNCGHEPTNADGVITVANGHTMTVTADVTVDQVVLGVGGGATTTITINSGATLTVADGTDTDLTFIMRSAVNVNGTLSVLAGASIAGGGGSGTTAPQITVNSGGTLTMTGTLTSSGSGPTNITIQSGGTGDVTGSITGVKSVTVSGTLNVNGGTVTANGGSIGFVTVNSGGTLSETGAATVSGNAGNNSVTVTISGTATLAGTSTIAATGSSLMQVAGGGTLELGPTATVIGNNFTLQSGGNLKIASTEGIASVGATGNIQSTTRSYNSGANYTYNGVAAQDTGVFTTTAPANTVSNLTIDNAAGVTLSGNLTCAGLLSLTDGDLMTTGSFVLTQSGTGNVGLGSSATGTGDVVGTVRRTDVGTDTRSFGNVNVQINAGLAAITTLTVKLVKMSPPDAQSAVDRTYTITKVSAGDPGPTSSIRLRYIDSELHGNAEATLELWKKIDATWTAQSFTTRDATANWVEKVNIGTFSDWIINGPTAPTDVAMVDLKATRFDNRVLLEWQTGYEVSNLGFHVYRGQKGDFTRITTDPIAGSALLFGPKVALRAGFAYTWWDNNPPAGDDATYWIEDLDISGRTSIKGPFHISSSAPAGKFSALKVETPTLGEIVTRASQLGSSAPVERRAAATKLTPVTLAAQAANASQQAVKLSVKHEGWYRVEKTDLIAAGLSSNADPQKLQLIVDGIEVPIQVTAPASAPVKVGRPTVAPWDGIEFYGIGIDSQYTDSHIYWLTAGSKNGLRIGLDASQGGAPAGGSFQHSVERRDKVLYFAGVKNGGAEKFFGPPIFNSVAVDQSVVLKNIAAAGDATVDVSLQGLTEGFHNVRVLLNGVELGTVQFSGTAKGAAQYVVPQSSLLEGNNQIQFISPAGFADITLADFVRVTYEHTNKADNNSLRFPAIGSQLATIGGFTTDTIRVVDVTNAGAPQEVAVTVAPDGAEFAATFTVPGAGARTLLAFASDQKKTPASLVANQPSSWKTSKIGATYIAVTRTNLIESLNPLLTHRRNQGHKTAVVDIEDVYDEFNFGHKSPQALKDFFAYAKSNWKISPRFALLGGDATYDPRNYTGVGDFDIVPTRLVETNFNETATDDWLVDFNGDAVPDIAIGRLPVRSAPEAAALAAKIIRYDRSQSVSRVLMVADHNDGFDFEAADSQSQALIPANLTITSIRRGQLGDSLTRTQLLQALNAGAKFVNFYGHGSTKLWTDAQILKAADAPNLANTDRLALFDSMTCLTGLFHDVSIESLGEALLKSPGGAIAVWASSGMTDPSNQVLMNQEAIRQLFGGTGLTIGEVTVLAKGATGNADVRRTWILLGDPATKLR